MVRVGELLQLLGDLGIFRKIIVIWLMRMVNGCWWSLRVWCVDYRVGHIGIIIVVNIVVILSSSIVREDGKRSLQETLRHHSTRVHC